jgi:hypothetical protein
MFESEAETNLFKPFKCPFEIEFRSFRFEAGNGGLHRRPCPRATPTYKTILRPIDISNRVTSVNPHWFGQPPRSTNVRKVSGRTDLDGLAGRCQPHEFRCAVRPGRLKDMGVASQSLPLGQEMWRTGYVSPHSGVPSRPESPPRATHVHRREREKAGAGPSIGSSWGPHRRSQDLTD